MINIFLPDGTGPALSGGWCQIARREVQLGQASAEQTLPPLPQPWSYRLSLQNLCFLKALGLRWCRESLLLLYAR